MESLRQKIFDLHVVDMHNHLDVNPSDESVVAKDFWDIGEYFWVRRHLWSAGYPAEAEKLPFDERAREYVKAFKRAENTIWVRALKRGVRELYGVELGSLESVYELNTIIAEKAANPHYGKEIADKIGLEYFVVNGDGRKNFGELAPRAIHVEGVDTQLAEWSNEILNGRDVKSEVFAFIRALKEKGVAGIRTTIGRMTGHTYRKELIKPGMTYDDAQIAVLHYLSEVCGECDIFIQLFLGVAYDVSDMPGPYNDGEGVAKLYGLFEKYSCTFSLITSSQAQNIDVINAANVFSNVQADGLWWYNLRPSSYKEVFEMRLEELPSIRSSIIATDAYVIEWCYIKMNIIKETL